MLFPRKFLLFAFTVLLGNGIAAIACNPEFPAPVIMGDGSTLLEIPPGKFSTELNLLRPSGRSDFTAVLPSATTYESIFAESARIDTAELKDVLKQSNQPIDLQILVDYENARNQIMKHAQAIVDAREKAPEDRGKLVLLGNVQIPAGLPLEFDQYLRGLVAYHQDNLSEARKIWNGLLSLDADQRRHRSVWAAFMLGKSFLATDPAKAMEYFQLTRKLAAHGFVDRLGLAAASLGWEGRAEINAGQYCQAIELYLQQNWTGDPTAEQSLVMCASHIFSQGEKALTEAAKNPDARQVLTAYVISDFEPFYKMSDAEAKVIPAWLSAVENAAVNDMPGADRLAWMAYSSGDFSAAQRWVARSPADSCVAIWVKSKLLLREGKNDEAARQLVKVVRSFPVTQDLDRRVGGMDFDGPQPIARSITTDLAVLQLVRGQYVDSMRLLMMSDHWEDAAYIAERVLSCDELKAFVDCYCKEVDIKNGTQLTAWPRCSDQMRNLLARRLTRLGQWKIARTYFDADSQTKLDEYIKGIRDGHDKTLPASDRAAAYMSAAHIARKDGMDLLSTELEPDFHIYEGEFDMETLKSRLASTGMLAPSADELARVNASQPEDMRRFHYRYIAAGHAWAAAELLPDNDEQTAIDLNQGGTWLKAMDPQAANRFYKALVQRCPDTQTGRKAIELHWFPKI